MKFYGLPVALLVLLAPTALPQQTAQTAASADNDAPVNPFALDLDSLSSTKVITASKFVEKIAEAPSVITVISSDEIKRFGGFTLAQILSRVAGLNNSSGFFQDRSIISIRGDQSRVDGGHVLFLINGRPLREVLEGGVSSDILESFPIAILDHIEVIKGPGSVLYGSDAFAGVINLITKKAVGTSFSVQAAGGAGNAAASSADFLYARGDFNVVAAAQYHQLSVWNTDFAFLRAQNAQPSAEAIAIHNDGAGAYLGLNYKGLSFMSAYTGLEGISFVRNVIGNQRWKRGFTNLGYSLHASSKWEMTFDFTYNRNVFDVPQYPRIHRDSYQALFEWTNFITFSERDRLTFGTLANHIAGQEWLVASNPRVLLADGTRAALGFYAQHEHKLTDSVKLIAGFQLNKIGAISPNLVPRVGLLWSPDSHFTVKALYGGAFRSPSLDETLLNHPGLKGNPNLIPETTGSFDLQAGYQSNHFLVSVDYFHSSQKNLIVEVGTSIPARYFNLTVPAIFQGVDAEAKYYFHQNWFLTSSALYQVNGSAATYPRSPIPAFSAKAGLSYQTPSGFDLSVFDAYQGHTPGYSKALNPQPDAIHTVSAHFRYDLSKHRVKNRNLGIAPFLYADNLTNTPVWLPDWGGSANNTIPVNHGRTLLFGIEFWQKAE